MNVLPLFLICLLPLHVCAVFEPAGKQGLAGVLPTIETGSYIFSAQQGPMPEGFEFSADSGCFIQDSQESLADQGIWGFPLWDRGKEGTTENLRTCLLAWRGCRFALEPSLQDKWVLSGAPTRMVHPNDKSNLSGRHCFRYDGDATIGGQDFHIYALPHSPNRETPAKELLVCFNWKNENGGFWCTASFKKQ